MSIWSVIKDMSVEGLKDLQIEPDAYINKYGKIWKTKKGCKGGGCEPLYRRSKIIKLAEDINGEE